MTNTNIDELELVKSMERLRRADHLKRNIKKPLEEIMTTMQTEYGLFPEELTDMVLLLIFTHIDLLGYLYKGDNSSDNAVEFLREYLGRVDRKVSRSGWFTL